MRDRAVSAASPRQCAAAQPCKLSAVRPSRRRDRRLQPACV